MTFKEKILAFPENTTYEEARRAVDGFFGVGISSWWPHCDVLIGSVSHDCAVIRFNYFKELKPFVLPEGVFDATNFSISFQKVP